MEGTSSREGNKPASSVARIIVGITLVLWLIVYFLAKTLARDWHLALLPLYGLYPRPAATGGSSATFMHSWAIGMGAVFATLTWLGIDRKSKSAAAAFLILVILSTVVGYVRILAAVAGIQ